jgi:transcriptional regulator with PAS, ATPase and Fis domain
VIWLFNLHIQCGDILNQRQSNLYILQHKFLNVKNEKIESNFSRIQFDQRIQILRRMKLDWPSKMMNLKIELRIMVLYENDDLTKFPINETDLVINSLSVRNQIHSSVSHNVNTLQPAVVHPIVQWFQREGSGKRISHLHELQVDILTVKSCTST